MRPAFFTAEYTGIGEVPYTESFYGKVYVDERTFLGASEVAYTAERDYRGKPTFTGETSYTGSTGSYVSSQGYISR